ncbi:hypothetical protein [Sphingomonas sp. CCH9-E2]|uniref:hypothetical protein n=1 Tax=Sphingomonas sp. CCH9-E2 TaxID=1768776 RepID=UPI000832C4F8|nr:hypothetical protein [Sphingomonas sp. CCH9-E2]
MIPLALAVAASFNLVCVGTQDTIQFGKTVETDKPVRSTFSIDLEAKRFCFEGCEQTLPIASVSETEIVLQRTTIPKDKASFERTVNRESGEMYARIEIAGVALVTYSRCEAKPFTGFPVKKF